MSASPNEYKDAVARIFNDQFIGEVSSGFVRQNQFLSNYQTYFKDLCRSVDRVNDPAERRNTFSAARTKLLRTVDSHFQSFEESSLDAQFEGFLQSIDHFISTLPRRVTQPQVKERFKKQASDSVYIRFGKFNKRFFYAISKWHEVVTNGFRKLIKKEVKALKPRHHTIFLQRLARFYFREELLRTATLQQEGFYEIITSTSKALWKLDESFDTKVTEALPDKSTLELIEDIRKNLKKRQENFVMECNALLEQVLAEFEDAFYKAGTIELTNNRFNPRNLKKKHGRLVKKYSRFSRGWNNTIKVMSEDWEIDLELYAVIHAAQGQLYTCSKSLEKKVRSGIIPGLEHLESIIQAHSTKVENANSRQLKELLTETLSDVKSGLLAKPAQETVDIVLAQDLPSLINQVEAGIDRRINNIESKRSVVSGSDYDKPVRSSAISTVSPFELINFESWPQFKKVAQQVKIETTSHINNIIATFQSLNQIAEFNIESAIAMYGDDADGDPKAIAMEGLARTSEKIKDVHTELNSIQSLVDETLQQAVDEFNQSLIKFTNNENIFDIKVRIARAKAVERGKNVRDRVITRVKNALPTIVRFVSMKYRKGSEWVKSTFKKYGINAEQELISTELADFLAETENSIDKLPFVYQRLFRSQALEDLSFYESRNAEVRQLSLAYNNWTKQRFAPSIVVGEKGSGLTTLLHSALREIGSPKPVIHISSQERILVPDDITSFFSSQLNTKFKNIEALIKYLNEGPKRIIVIENLQRMYLRKVGGFDCLSELLQLITITSRNVFWMVSCTLYAWNYLEKTTRLSEHFGYVVKLEEFNSEQILRVINKRHQERG